MEEGLAGFDRSFGSFERVVVRVVFEVAETLAPSTDSLLK